MKPIISATLPAFVLAFGLAYLPMVSFAQTEAGAETEIETETDTKLVERQIAAAELVAVSQVDAMVEQLTFLFTNDILPLLIEANPGMEDTLHTIVVEEVSAAAEEIAPNMISFMSTIWARHFTIEEIRELTAFYRTSVGQKLLEMQPVIAQESNKSGVELSKQASYHAMNRLRERMNAENLVVPNRL